MTSCLLPATDQNLTIPIGTSSHASYQLWQFNASLARCAVCSDPTYLRPDVAGSLLPWLYTLVMILIHLPTVIIRVVQWEKAQFLALCLAVFNIAVTIQAFASTRLQADNVLVWMPLTVPLDAGAMLQLMVLLYEHDSRLRWRVRKVRAQWTSWRRGMGLRLGQGERGRVGDQDAVSLRKMMLKSEEDLRRDSTMSDHSDQALDADANVKAATTIAHSPIEDRPSRNPTQIPDAPPLPVKSIFIMSAALFVFIVLLILQFLALHAAATGKLQSNLTVSWCSPIFQPFGLAVLDGNGNTHPILDQSKKGIGCIPLDAVEQRHWLTATLVIVSASVVFEITDLIIMVCVKASHLEDKRKKVRRSWLRRPWLTMVSGVAILVVLTCFAVFQSSELPADITSAVWVFRHDTSTDTLGACRGVLKPGGLRGAILAWTDGLLSNWGTTYFGYS